ncbi:hypothetical protein SAMN05444144_102115 [Flavobacterium akiainvivens]|nr:hypothetical protein SAMN05444144_102115 [Flavobacterium akiainvivens]
MYLCLKITAMEPVEFKVNDTLKQFELHVEGEVAYLEYFFEGKKIFLTHTETPKSLRGKGYAKELVKRSLEHTKQHKYVVVPACSFVADYVNHNPEWRAILSEGYQM